MKTIKYILISVMCISLSVGFLNAESQWSTPLDNNKQELVIQKIIQVINKKWRDFRKKILSQLRGMETKINPGKKPVFDRLMYLVRNESTMESPFIGKNDCVTEKQFGESFDFLSTPGVKPPTFHFETDKNKVSSIEIGEGEIINIMGVVDYLDPKTDSASFRWFDDSGNANFCKIDKKDPKYTSIKWKAPQVDSDLIIALGAQLQAYNAPPVTSYLQIKVVNTDKSQIQPFSISSLVNDQNYPSGTRLPNIKLIAHLDSPQEIIKVYSSTKHEGHDFGEFGNEFRFKKISSTEYSIELDTAFDLSKAPRDIRVRLQNDRNVFAEKEILNVPMPEKQIPFL